MPSHPIFQQFSPVEYSTSGIHIYDFVGAATRVSYKRAWAAYALGAGRQVRASEPPKNEHYLDWIGVLTAVDRAGDTFRMAELGAGWAPWLVRAALAARQRPQIKNVELLAVEADPTHFDWVREHFEDNGIAPDSHTLLHGAVGKEDGRVTFPVIEDPDVNYGAAMLPEGSSAQNSISLPSFSIKNIVDRFSGPIDFMHIDIQGAEYDAIPPAIDVMNQSVKSVMIGTHLSDAQHDGLVRLLMDAGWVEAIALGRNRSHVTPWGEIATGDGFLLFDNPRFA